MTTSPEQSSAHTNTEAAQRERSFSPPTEREEAETFDRARFWSRRRGLTALLAATGVGLATIGVTIARSQDTSSDSRTIDSTRPTATSEAAPRSEETIPTTAPYSSAAPTTPESTGNPYINEQQTAMETAQEALAPFSVSTISASDFASLIDPQAMEAVFSQFPRMAFDHRPGGGERVTAQSVVSAENVIRVRQQLHAYLTNSHLEATLPTMFAHPFAAPGAGVSPEMSTPAQLVGAYRDMYPTTHKILWHPSVSDSQVPENDPYSFVAANHLNPGDDNIAIVSNDIYTGPSGGIESPIDPASVTPLYVTDVPMYGTEAYGMPDMSVAVITTIHREVGGQDVVSYWAMIPVGDMVTVGTDGSTIPGASSSPDSILYPVLAYSSPAA